ncbi:unnamed protein product [Schistosoma curassoni]|uniref:60S ribosomal protein L12 n=1 Tax=Schistosoma curassoni TaxID=6186 RepID=A0A183L0S5_9TREM|nr:unnamed protein product [Schistosoma curassoni]
MEVASTDLPTDVTPSTTEGIRMAIRQIKIEKAAGPDSILAKALKLDIKVTENMLHTPCSKIRKKEQSRQTRKKDTSSRYKRKEI